MAYTPPPPPQPYLPNVTWTTNSSTVASRSDLQTVAADPSDQQIQVVAENAPLRILYGRVRVGAQIADVLTYQNKLIVFAVWGQGEIDAVESVTVGDKPLPAGVTATHYTGTAGQTADPTLIAAYAASGVTYADNLPGVAYSVFQVAVGSVTGFPVFAAIIRGLKVYDPRTGTTVYSDTPALAQADFIESTIYGLDRDIDWSTVTTVANANETLIGGEKHRLIGLVIDTVQQTSQWCEALRTYAGCFVQYDEDPIRLVPDAPSASVFTFDNSNIVSESMRISKRGVQQIPTVLEIVYTDTTKLPWSSKSAIVKAAGVDAGTTPRRESQINLVGIQRYSQAYREAVERLNKLQLSDLTCSFIAFDEALKIQVGDVITVTHSLGLSSKQMRVTDIQPVETGRWQIHAEEYDPAAYSSIVQSEPTYSDTNLPDPAEPPEISGLLAVEEVFQLDTGDWSSRLYVTWDAADYLYLRDYRVEVYSNDNLISTATTREAVYRTGAVQEGIEYVVKVAAISTLPAVGLWAQYNITPLGKALIPGDVPTLTAFEAGGRVYGTAGKAIDIDIIRYEWRYWPVGGSWATGIVLDEADSLRLVVDTIPEGTWVVGVKAVDSVRQTSANAKTATVVVTSDSNSFLVDAYESDTPALTNMAAYTLHPTDPNTYYITEDGVAWGTKFPNAMSTYTNPIGSYHNSVTSTWLGEAEDFGLLLSGQWNGEAVVADVSGSHASSIGFSVDGSAYSYLDGLSHKTNARFARLKHEALTTSTMKVTVPGQTIRLNAVPHSEVGSGTSSASGPVTVKLSGEYTKVQSIPITLLGSTPRNYVLDNIIVGPRVANADFEAATLTDWALVAGTGTCSRTTSIVHDGTAAMLFDSPTASYAYGCRAIPVTPGQIIKLRAWVYSSAAVAGGFYLWNNEKAAYPDGGYVTTANRTRYTEIIGNAALAAGWQLKEGTYTVPSGVYWVSVSFYHWTGMASAGATLAIDSVEFDNNAFDIRIFDGSGAGIASDFLYEFNGV